MLPSSSARIHCSLSLHCLYSVGMQLPRFSLFFILRISSCLENQIFFLVAAPHMLASLWYFIRVPSTMLCPASMWWREEVYTRWNCHVKNMGSSLAKVRTLVLDHNWLDEVDAGNLVQSNKRGWKLLLTSLDEVMKHDACMLGVKAGGNSLCCSQQGYPFRVWFSCGVGLLGIHFGKYVELTLPGHSPLTKALFCVSGYFTNKPQIPLFQSDWWYL
jgi:hypothetical protein